jgi:hypothetical protein
VTAGTRSVDRAAQFGPDRPASTVRKCMSRCVRREFVDHQFDGHVLSVNNANVFAINPHGNCPSYRSDIGWSQRSARLLGAIGRKIVVLQSAIRDPRGGWVGRCIAEAEPRHADRAVDTEGYRHHDDPLGLYRVHDSLVSPGRSENWGSCPSARSGARSCASWLGAIRFWR